MVVPFLHCAATAVASAVAQVKKEKLEQLVLAEEAKPSATLASHLSSTLLQP
jgi:hypothetical protein